MSNQTQITSGHSTRNHLFRSQHAEPRQALATTPPLEVTVFGSLAVWWHPTADGDPVEITDELQRRSCELLIVLALHPTGLARTTLLDTLWNRCHTGRPDKSLTTAVGRLRGSLRCTTGGTVPDLLRIDRHKYRLDPTVVEVDYWKYRAAVSAQHRAITDSERMAAYRDIVAIAGNKPLAAELTKTWIEPIREDAHQETTNALTALARHHTDQDPRTALALFELAAQADPYNEPLWQQILHLHARLGEYEAIHQTLTNLTRKLARIGEKPTDHTVQLAHQLQYGK